MRQFTTTYSIYYHSGYGDGHDIRICDAATTKESCYSDLGVSYEHPQPSQGQSYLAGSSPFLLSEIEVYQKE